MSLEGPIKRFLASGVDLLRAAFVNVCGRHHPDAAVPVLMVVPMEVAAAEAPRIVDGTESIREARAVFEGLELRFRVRVVIGNVRPAVALRDPKIEEEIVHRSGNRGRRNVAGLLTIQEGSRSSGLAAWAMSRGQTWV
jgi:hypothetical protein